MGKGDMAVDFSNKIKAKIKSNGKRAVPSMYYFRIMPGYELFCRLMESYPKDAVMFLCPYAGTGDVYLACLYMTAYAKKEQIKDFVVAVIGGSNFKVASLFSFKNVIKISQQEADSLVRLCMFLDKSSDRLRLMHHQPPQCYCGILEMMRNIHDLNFTDLFLYNVFNVDLYNDREEPVFDYLSENIEKLFIENRLVPGKTVILSPYVNTLPSLPWWVWVNIAHKLKDKGYVVCTNCGSPDEYPINGTIPLRFDYKISVPVIENCGYFLGIRNGFCDIISSAKCKKIIIYQPYLFWGSGTNFDYFSLKKIGMCDDAVELSYQGVEFLKLIDDIMEQFE